MAVSLAGKSFVVTGGLGSIGGATSRLLVAKGASVIVLDIPSAEIGASVISKWENSERFAYEVCNIVEEESVKRAVYEGMKKFPNDKFWGGVNCAGAAQGQPWTNKLLDKLKDFEHNLKVNAIGTFLVNGVLSEAINSQYPPLEKFAARVTEERGVLINIASVVAFDTPARCLTYGPSKTAVVGITNAVADFLGPQGIRVNSVSPGVVFSPMLDKGGRAPYFQEELDEQAIFPRRFQQADEMAHAICFLIENPVMNAFHLKADGGWRMCTPWGKGAEGDPRIRAAVVE
ncbi:NAD(P)-binding protein [Meredithblackwellia eburnea MCA 4105]